MIEEFRDVKGFEGLYQVSDLGNVKSLTRKGCLKNRILKPTESGIGYLQVNLSKLGKLKPFTVHALVAGAFLGHKTRGCKLVIDHINNDKLDNRTENLQLVTQRNNLNKDRKGVSKYIGVSFRARNKKWTSSILVDGKRKYLGDFYLELEAAYAYQDALKAL